MPPKEKKTKEQIAKAAAAGGKAKKKKWSKGKVRDKLNNLVLFDKATLEKFTKEVCALHTCDQHFSERGTHRTYLSELSKAVCLRVVGIKAYNSLVSSRYPRTS